MAQNDWKKQLGLVYSTNPDAMQVETVEDEVKIPPRQQVLCISFQRRNGKPATLITGFQGSDADLKELAKFLKLQCGVGGSARGGEILIQGDARVKVRALLQEKGFRVKGE